MWLDCGTNPNVWTDLDIYQRDYYNASPKAGPSIVVFKLARYWYPGDDSNAWEIARYHGRGMLYWAGPWREEIEPWAHKNLREFLSMARDTVLGNDVYGRAQLRPYNWVDYDESV